MYQLMKEDLPAEWLPTIITLHAVTKNTRSLHIRTSREELTYAAATCETFPGAAAGLADWQSFLFQNK
jgi:hypothetical protein